MGDMTAREVEDLPIPCPECGTFVTGMIGSRDWLSRHRPYQLDGWHDRDDELRELIDQAESSALGRLWKRVKRITSRHDDEPEEEELVDDDDERPWIPKPVTVTRERLDDPDDQKLTCDDSTRCDGELPLTWNELAAAHDRMTPADVLWLESYTRAKELVRLGLFRAGIDFRTPLGTFSTKASQPLESPYGMIAGTGAPLFVASAKLAKLCGAIDPETMLSQMAGDERCSSPAYDDPVNLPIYYESPKVTVDLELGLDVARIAGELRDRGATPLRGFGTLKLLEVDWVSVAGKLLFLDFNEALREAIANAFYVRGGDPE